MNFWTRYVNYYITHYSTLNRENSEELAFLRNKLFISILIWAFPICLISYIPSIWVSIETRSWVIALFDTLAMGTLTFIYLAKSISMNAKKNLFSIIFYVLSIVLFIYLGTTGPSIIILFCSSVLVTLFSNAKAGYIALVLNGIIFLFFLAIIPVNTWHFQFFKQLHLDTWIGIGVNLIAFNALAIFSVASLVEHLSESFLREKQLQILLKKESEDLRVAKQRAEESDRLKSSFMANMSHEIRTPMNGILGFSSLLSEENLKESDRQMYVDLIQKSGERMLNIINEIIDISKIESGLVNINSSEENLNEILRYIYDFMLPDATKKNIALTYSLGLTDVDTVIYTDREKLYIILLNLVKNAIKFTDKGEINFGYEVQSLIPGDDKIDIAFFVKDTGIGIPLDKQAVIFERFMQVDVKNVKAREGAGLGLYISKSYVELMGGKIWLESEIGKGTTFNIVIPFSTPQRVKQTHK